MVSKNSLLSFLFFSFTSIIPHTITNKLEPWRRLGDNIQTICKTKYFQKEFGLKFLCTPFDYYQEFELHKKEKTFDKRDKKKFSKVILVNTSKDIQDNINCDEPILFECHFLSQTPNIFSFLKSNSDFEEKIKELFTPLIPIEKLPHPAGIMTVAVHVRKGGGYDKPLASLQEYSEPITMEKGFYIRKKNIYSSSDDLLPLSNTPSSEYFSAIQKLYFLKNSFSDYIWPIKFPPDQYYIDQIKYLASLFPEENLLIYLFTDDPHPQEIVKRYSHALKKYPRIVFSYRAKDNSPNKNVLQDLFQLAQCDCIISASSSFAMAAQLLGNHSTIIFPTHALTFPDKIFIHKVGVVQVYPVKNNSKKQHIFFNEITHKIK